MAEGPTAEPEPVPWGSEDDPFPVGTQLIAKKENADSMTVTEVTDKLVFLDNAGYKPEEVQGQIEAGTCEPKPPRDNSSE